MESPHKAGDVNNTTKQAHVDFLKSLRKHLFEESIEGVWSWKGDPDSAWPREREEDSEDYSFTSSEEDDGDDPELVGFSLEGLHKPVSQNGVMVSVWLVVEV